MQVRLNVFLETKIAIHTISCVCWDISKDDYKIISPRPLKTHSVLTLVYKCWIEMSLHVYILVLLWQFLFVQGQFPWKAINYIYASGILYNLCNFFYTHKFYRSWGYIIPSTRCVIESAGNRMHLLLRNRWKEHWFLKCTIEIFWYLLSCI